MGVMAFQSRSKVAIQSYNTYCTGGIATQEFYLCAVSL